MYKDIVAALEEWFDGKYDLSPLIANRSAAVIKNFFLSRLFPNRWPQVISKNDYNEYMQSLSTDIRRQSYYKFLKRILILFKNKLIESNFITRILRYG